MPRSLPSQGREPDSRGRIIIQQLSNQELALNYRISILWAFEEERVAHSSTKEEAEHCSNYWINNPMVTERSPALVQRVYADHQIPI